MRREEFSGCPKCGVGIVTREGCDVCAAYEKGKADAQVVQMLYEEMHTAARRWERGGHVGDIIQRLVDVAEGRKVPGSPQDEMRPAVSADAERAARAQTEKVCESLRQALERARMDLVHQRSDHFKLTREAADRSLERCDNALVADAPPPRVRGALPQHLEIEMLEVLDNTGMGKAGKPNTLWAMVMEACEKVVTLTGQVDALKDEREEIARIIPLGMDGGRLVDAIRFVFDTQTKRIEKAKRQIENLVRVIEGLAEQQAMPDDSWKTMVDEILTPVAPEKK